MPKFDTYSGYKKHQQKLFARIAQEGMRELIMFPFKSRCNGCQKRRQCFAVFFGEELKLERTPGMKPVLASKFLCHECVNEYPDQDAVALAMLAGQK